MESWVTWFVDNPPTDQEANDTVMEKCRQWIQLRTEIGADNLAKFLTTTESTASPNGYFSLASDSFQASISQGVSSGSVGLKSLADFSLSPFPFRGGRTRSAVNNSTASPLSRADSQKERSHSQELPVTPRSTGAQPHGNLYNNSLSYLLRDRENNIVYLVINEFHFRIAKELYVCRPSDTIYLVSN